MFTLVYILVVGFQSLKEQTRRAVEVKTEATNKLDQLEHKAKVAERKHDSVNEVLPRSTQSYMSLSSCLITALTSPAYKP